MTTPRLTAVLCIAATCGAAHAQQADFVRDPRTQQALHETVRELNGKLAQVRGVQTYEYRICPDGSISLDCTGHDAKP